MLTDRLITEIGLLKLQAKNLNTSPSSPQQPHEPATIQAESAIEPQQPVKAVADNRMDEVKLDKNEFRLLVKMLQAIGHQCTYDHINYDGHTVTYQHPKKTLVFNDITLADTNQSINLSSLSDLLSNDQLKRPVWEKLKELI
ncbi:hypothetical protein MNBD_GAMMA02-284 [hydrothermal vent metagenome]|uniref:Uncharacterized protein n=1 Tax=hydrothermal vent metagenome TaxID=652676 RepID=A0A3B0W0N8_9ZZZZ